MAQLMVLMLLFYEQNISINLTDNIHGLLKSF